MKDWSADPRGSLRETIGEYVEEAKTRLTANDELRPVVLLQGPTTFLSVDIADVPPDVAMPVVRELCESNPDIECAIHISLAFTVVKDEGLPIDSIPSDPHRRLELIVHGAHRDVGMLAAHVAITRIAAREFEFGAIEWPAATRIRGHLLDGLWGPRHLNS